MSQALVEEMRGIMLQKELQSSDWWGPPSDEELRYAVEDVTRLLPL
jgi:ribonuclease D